MENNKTNLITSETLMEVRPDISILEAQVATKYLNTEYGSKGNCLTMLSPYHDDIYTREHGCHLINLIKIDGCSPQPWYLPQAVARLTSTVKSLTMQLNPITGNALVESFPRASVEHNPGYWQLVVCGVVKVEEGYVFLKNKGTHPRLADMVTSIQGHVDPSVDMHFMSGSDYFTREFVRELVEEISIDFKKYNHGIDYVLAHTDLTGAIQINTDAVAMEHLGLFYVTDISRSYSFGDLITNEPDKHDLILVKDSSVLKQMKHDSWIPHIIDRILEDE